MAISNVAAVAQSGGAPGDPKYTNLVTLDLDDSYTTGGYADFTASVQSIIGAGRAIVGVVQQNIPAGTVKVLTGYDYANDKLLCYVASTGVVTGLALMIHSL